MSYSKPLTNRPVKKPKILATKANKVKPLTNEKAKPAKIVRNPQLPSTGKSGMFKKLIGQ